MKSSAKGFKVLFERYAAMGRQGLTSDMFHEANKEEGIWEFVKGRLRVFCFLDRGDLVILTHGAIKKSQKASHSEVVHAVRVKKEYLADKQIGNIQIERCINEY